MKEITNKSAIKSVIVSILEVADRERKESKPYKDMFKRTSGKPFCVQLMEVESAMMDVVFNYHKILEENGYKLSNEAFIFLYSLPVLAKALEKDIREKEGNACCVDKTYTLLHQEFYKLITKIKEEK
jgi:hypothetical protein